MSFVLYAYASNEVVGNDVQAWSIVLRSVVSMVSHSTNEASAFHLNVYRVGNKELNASAEGVDVNLLILGDGSLAKVQAYASAEGIEACTTEVFAMIYILVAAVVNRAAYALSVLIERYWAL